MSKENRAAARNFRDLLVWQKAHALVLDTYRATTGFPRHEMYGLTAQLRRAVVSIAANIVEAFGKRGERDKARLLNVAEGSLEEARYYLILATDLGYADCTSLLVTLDEVGRLLHNYRSKILSSISPGAV